nr:hypothetical protein [Tanacetum cinerariifolium]
LITTEIQKASYYREYLAKVAQHQRYLAGETGSVQDSPALKPTKPARKPKTTAPKAPSRPSVSTLVTSAQPAPTSAPTKPHKKKHVSIMKPQVADEDTELQKVLEESMKTAYAFPRGPLPVVVIREPESGKYQPLPEVLGKGKAKVTEEQVAHDLLSLQMPKKKSPADQYIFQRRISKPIRSSLHDESPYVVLGQSDSEEESEKVVLRATEGGKDEDQAGPDPGQARPDPGNARAEVQSIPSHVVYAGSDREHMDLDVADVSPQPSTEQLDEGDVSFGDQFFSDKPSDADKNAETKVKSMVNVPIQQALSSIYLMTSLIIDHTSRPESPKVHQQFKATTTDTTTTTTTTTTTLPPPQAQQQSTAEAMMMKRIGELEHIMANLIQVNKEMEERIDKHRARLYTDLPKADMKEIFHQRMWEMESYKYLEDHMQLFKAHEKSMNRDHSEELVHDLGEARKKKKKGRESPKMPPGSPAHQPPPPPPPARPSRASGALVASGSSQQPPPSPPPSSTNQESLSKGFAAPSPSKTATSAEYQAWMITDIRLRPSISLTLADLEMDEDMALNEEAQLSDDKDIESVHIPKVNLRQDWWKPLEEKRHATIKPAWSILPSDAPVPLDNWASALASNYSPPPEDSLLAVDDPILRNNVSKPLPLGGPPMKAAYYPDAGLEQMVPDQFWIHEECKYDIAAMYGISHWWFQRQRFYIDRHTSEGDRSAVRTHMRILSVV